MIFAIPDITFCMDSLTHICCNLNRVAFTRKSRFGVVRPDYCIFEPFDYSLAFVGLSPSGFAESKNKYCWLFLLNFTLEVFLEGLALVLQLYLLSVVLTPHLVYLLSVLLHLLYLTQLVHFNVFTGYLGAVGCSWPILMVKISDIIGKIKAALQELWILINSEAIYWA